MNAQQWLVQDQRRRSAAAEETLLWIQAFAAFNTALHELQRERGLSSSYQSSSGRQFAKELTYQYERTDRTWQAAWQALMSTDLARWPQELQRVWVAARDRFQERSSLRQLVQTLEWAPDRVPEAYSILIEGILVALEGAMLTWGEPPLEGWSAQVPLRRWKEALGQERAWGALVMSDQDQVARSAWAERKVVRQHWETELLRQAPEILSAQIRALVVSAPFLQRETMLERLLAPGTRPVSVSLFSWFEVASAVMEELRTLEVTLSAQLEAQQNLRKATLDDRWMQLTEGWGRLGKRLQRQYGLPEDDADPATLERRLLREVEQRRASRDLSPSPSAAKTP